MPIFACLGKAGVLRRRVPIFACLGKAVNYPKRGWLCKLKVELCQICFITDKTYSSLLQIWTVNIAEVSTLMPTVVQLSDSLSGLVGSPDQYQRSVLSCRPSCTLYASITF